MPPDPSEAATHRGRTASPKAMAAAADPGEGSVPPPPRNPVEEFPTGVLEGLPWVDYAVEQAQLIKGTVDEAVGSAVHVARSRWSEIRSTSSSHLQQTLFALQEALGDAGALYADYERAAFGKLKEGILIAASHPTVSCGVAASVGIFASRRTRHYVVRNTLHFLVRKESLLSSTENKAKVLRQSVDVMKLERQKLEERASMAKNQMEWGKTELIKASNQILGALHSVYNIESKATGLKIILRELPGKEASQFRSKLCTHETAAGQQGAPERSIMNTCNQHTSDAAAEPAVGGAGRHRQQRQQPVGHTVRARARMQSIPRSKGRINRMDNLVELGLGTDEEYCSMEV